MKALCYLCGASNATSQDHIPPKAFFPQPRPSNLITVAACLSCNNGFSQDDDYFRIVFASAFGRSEAGNRIWENRVVPKSLGRHPKDIDEILLKCQEVAIETPNGSEDIVSFEIEHSRLDRFCTRIVKGLIRFHHPDYDYYSSKFEVRLEPRLTAAQHSISDIQPFLKTDQRGEAVFS